MMMERRITGANAYRLRGCLMPMFWRSQFLMLNPIVRSFDLRVRPRVRIRIAGNGIVFPIELARPLVIAIVLSLLLCFVGVAVSFAEDPNMGTWKLNEAKSTLAPGAAKNHTVLYEAAGDNWRNSDCRRPGSTQKLRPLLHMLCTCPLIFLRGLARRHQLKSGLKAAS